MRNKKRPAKKDIWSFTFCRPCRPPGCRCLTASSDMPQEYFKQLEAEDKYHLPIYFYDPDIPGVNLEVAPADTFDEFIDRLQAFLIKFTSEEFHSQQAELRKLFNQHVEKCHEMEKE